MTWLLHVTGEAKAREDLKKEKKVSSSKSGSRDEDIGSDRCYEIFTG